MNPYEPPKSEVGRAEPANRRPVAFAVLGLTLVQLVWLLSYAAAYLELLRTGAASMLPALSGLIGCLLLYAGAVGFALNASRGGLVFIIASVLLAFSAWGWHLQYAWSYPFLLGSAIAIAGAWLSRRRAGH
jgi:hypothetical protein